MYALFRSAYLYKAILLVLVIFFALLLDLFIKLFLPTIGVDYESKGAFESRQIYRLSELFYDTNSRILSGSTQNVSTQSNYTLLDQWVLQALYKEGKKGFIVVKVDGQSHYLLLGETLQGYKLINIIKKEAILDKSGREYRLSLGSVTQDRMFQEVQTKGFVPNIAELSQGIVKRNDINYHMSHPVEIWHAIKIAPYKSGREDAGFIVNHVEKGSVFDHLGLQTGDILWSVNNTRLKSIEEAKLLYANIDHMSAFTITIHRQGKTKELLYEIQ